MPDVWLGLGSNLGDRRAMLRAALRDLTGAGMAVGAVSSLYATAPQGVVDQPEFLNAVVRATTERSPPAVLDTCQSIEREHGRLRDLRWGPRTLDIDVLFYDDLTAEGPELVLPHPEMWNRAFVLAPLLELWPDLRDANGAPGDARLTALLRTQAVRRIASPEWWT